MRRLKKTTHRSSVMETIQTKRNFHDNNISWNTEFLQSLLDQLGIEHKHRSGKELLIELMASVALVESSIARILEAQARKVESFVGLGGDFPTNPTSHQIVEFQYITVKLISALVEKQKLIIRKVQTAHRLLKEETEAEKIHL